MKKHPKIAIVCDWLTNLGGAERVVEQMHKAFPEAPIYTSLYNPEALPSFAKADVRVSWLQKIPGAKKRHQLFLALMPRVFESFDLSEYDVVISSSFACAKGIITPPSTLHLCYCHNPTRYFWDESHEFWRRYRMPRLLKMIGGYFLHGLRMWDQVASQRPDRYLANSEFVVQRIKKYYHRDATVLYPGIELSEPLSLDRGESYLAVGRITAHKYFDLLVDTFNELKLPLKIVGTGNALAGLKERNMSDKTEFLGFVSDEELVKLYASSKALIFPQCEDFGVVPVEAQAQGCPVIAYKAGGVLETVGESGVLFEEQTVASLIAAIRDFEKGNVDHGKIRKQAEKFGAKEFRAGLLTSITQ